MHRIDPFAGDGQWYKGNTHAHSTISDGRLPPEQVVGLYREMGYDFLALTDHRVYGVHGDLSDESLVVLPGVEVDCWNLGGDGMCHHVVGLGVPGRNRLAHGQVLDYADDIRVEALVRFLNGNGNVCLYAHPTWSLVRHEVLAGLEGLLGVEVYNHGCEVACADGQSEGHWNRMLWQGSRAFAIASDDTHQHQLDYGGGWICVKARERTAEALVDSILAGRFYASRGPRIDGFSVEDGVVCLGCSPCRSIGFQVDSQPGMALDMGDVRRPEGAGYDADGFLVSARIPLRGGETYVRGVCEDRWGRRAWTQPIRLGETA